MLQQARDAFQINDHSGKQRLPKHLQTASVTGVAHVVSVYELGELAFDGRVLLARRLGLCFRLSRLVFCFIVVLGHRAAARLRIRETLAAAWAVRALLLGETKFSARIVAVA